MKRIILTAAIFLSCIAYKSASAQISLNINIGSQPEWGPVGYDRANYYYLPDIDTYYDVSDHRYIYLENNIWVRRVNLPVRYRNYNLYSGYKVVVNEPDPWVRNNVYRVKYANYKGRNDQIIIRDSKEVKYRNHWVSNRPVRTEHRKVVVDRRKNVRQDGKGQGHDRGHRN